MEILSKNHHSWIEEYKENHGEGWNIYSFRNLAVMTFPLGEHNILDIEEFDFMNVDLSPTPHGNLLATATILGSGTRETKVPHSEKLVTSKEELFKFLNDAHVEAVNLSEPTKKED